MVITLLYVCIFTEPGVQTVQGGGEGDVQMTAVNGDVDGASGGKEEEMEEGEIHPRSLHYTLNQLGHLAYLY